MVHVLSILTVTAVLCYRLRKTCHDAQVRRRIPMKKKQVLLFTLLLGLAFLGLRPVSAAAAVIRQTKSTKNSISISWDKPYADSTSYTVTGYELRYIKYADYTGSAAIDSRKAVKLGADRTSYTVKDLKPGTKYSVKLTYTYTYNYSGEKRSSYYSTSDLYTLPGKVTGVNQTRWYHFINQANFSWNKQDACHYQWRVTKNNGNSYAKENDAYSNNGTISKTSNNMTYKLRVRAFVTDKAGKKHYGEWSDTAFLFGQPMLNSGKLARGKLTVKWDRVSGMTHYRVYVSKKQDSGYKLVKTLPSTKGSISIAKLGSSAIKNNGTYYVYVVGVKKVGSNTYTSGLNYIWVVSKNNFKYVYSND